jgi:hypothetical protein
MGSRRKLLLVLVLLPVLRLFAQESYRPAEEPHFIQGLSWYADENALRYEVVIEEVRDAGNREVLRQSTEGDSLEFSLPAGSYRYRIRAWDIFEKPTAYSPWSPFEILQALRPRLSGVSVEGSALLLRGQNLIPGAVVRLKDRGGGAMATGEFHGAKEADSGMLVLPSPLRPGNYELSLENPGGFSATISFRVDREKAPGPLIQISAAYSPLIPLYGEFNELLDTPFYPAGALLRLEFFPLRFGEDSGGFSLGLGLSPAWHLLSTSYVMAGNNFELSGHFLGAQGFVLGQIRLSQSMAISLRAGGGVFLLKNLNKHYSGKTYDTIDVLLPAGSGGLSFLWAFKEPFFAEAGLEFTHFFSVDKPAPGYLRPFLGLGSRF